MQSLTMEYRDKYMTENSTPDETRLLHPTDFIGLADNP